MAAVLAAASHDVDHPGVNQTFLSVTDNPLASFYAVCMRHCDSTVSIAAVTYDGAAVHDLPCQSSALSRP